MKPLIGDELEYAINIAHFENAAEKYITVRQDGKAFTFSFNDIESCARIWNRIQFAKRVQYELTDIDAQRFWWQCEVVLIVLTYP